MVMLQMPIVFLSTGGQPNLFDVRTSAECDSHVMLWNFPTKLFEILSIGRKPIPHLGEGLCAIIHAVIPVNKREVLQTHCM